MTKGRRTIAVKEQTHARINEMKPEGVTLDYFLNYLMTEYDKNEKNNKKL